MIAGLVRFVQSSTSNQITTENQAAAVQENREAEILVAQDQAPRTVHVRSHAAPGSALDRAIRADMATLIAQGQLDGPLQRSSCTPTGQRHAAMPRFRCAVLADGVSYPFVGVLDARAGTITYCKRDPPPIPSENVPLSRRCTA